MYLKIKQFIFYITQPYLVLQRNKLLDNNYYNITNPQILNKTFSDFGKTNVMRH